MNSMVDRIHLEIATLVRVMNTFEPGSEEYARLAIVRNTLNWVLAPANYENPTGVIYDMLRERNLALEKQLTLEINNG